jgi:hypothetical protein
VALAHGGLRNVSGGGGCHLFKPIERGVTWHRNPGSLANPKARNQRHVFSLTLFKASRQIKSCPLSPNLKTQPLSVEFCRRVRRSSKHLSPKKWVKSLRSIFARPLLFLHSPHW